MSKFWVLAFPNCEGLSFSSKDRSQQRKRKVSSDANIESLAQWCIISLQSGDLHLYLESIILSFRRVRLCSTLPHPSLLLTRLLRGCTQSPAEASRIVTEPVVWTWFILMLYRSTWTPPIHLRCNWQRTEVSQPVNHSKPRSKPAGPALFPYSY